MLSPPGCLPLPWYPRESRDSKVMPPLSWQLRSPVQLRSVVCPIFLHHVTSFHCATSWFRDCEAANNFVLLVRKPLISVPYRRIRPYLFSYKRWFSIQK